jgi:hypothetical protein
MSEVLNAEVMPPEQEAKIALDGVMQVVTLAAAWGAASAREV